MAYILDHDQKIKALQAFLEKEKSYKITINSHSSISKLVEHKKGLIKDIKTLFKNGVELPKTYKLVFEDFVLLIDLDTPMEIGFGYLKFVDRYELEIQSCK